MSRRLNWERYNKRVDMYEERLTWVVGETTAAAIAGQRQDEYSLIDELMRFEFLSAGRKRMLERCRRYLDENPGRSLHMKVRDELFKLRIAFIRLAKMRAEGKEVQLYTDEQRASWLAENKMRRVRRWPKPVRPDWMNDPSLLPKRPPGKAP